MDDFLKNVHDAARRNDVPVMKDDGMEFLCGLIRTHTEIRDILECGTAVGYSAARMAMIRWDMTVDTIEVDPDMYEQAVKNIRAAGLSDRVHCYLGDAASFMTQKQYDLVFIDAAKSQYRRYLEHFYQNTHRGSFFVFDNLCFHGIVDDSSLSRNRSTIQMTHKIRRFRDHILSDPRFRTVFYPETGDGVAVAERLCDDPACCGSGICPEDI